MMQWMEYYQAQLHHRDMCVLVPSTLLNPEPAYYYQDQFDFE